MKTDYKLTNAYAAQDGLIVGIVWLVTFACFIGSIPYPELQFGFMLGVFATPLLAVFRLRNFRDKVLGGVIGYGGAFVFTVLMLLYASLILAVGVLCYFQFLDNGMFVGAIMKSFEMPEMNEAFKQLGMDMNVINAQMKLLAEMRPIDFAFNVLCEVALSSFILAMLVAVIGRKKTRKNNSTQK